MDWLIALGVAVLAYVWGRSDGIKRQTAGLAALMRDHYGLRDLDFDTRTLHFRDGSTHTERTP